jgi:hypothetical protein
MALILNHRVRPSQNLRHHHHHPTPRRQRQLTVNPVVGEAIVVLASDRLSTIHGEWSSVRKAGLIGGVTECDALSPCQCTQVTIVTLRHRQAATVEQLHAQPSFIVNVPVLAFACFQ